MRVVGLDVHRSFAVVVFLDSGGTQNGGRIELTRDAVIAFGRQLRSDDEVVIEATVNTSAASCGSCASPPARAAAPEMSKTRSSTHSRNTGQISIREEV